MEHHQVKITFKDRQTKVLVRQQNRELYLKMVYLEIQVHHFQLVLVKKKHNLRLVLVKKNHHLQLVLVRKNHHLWLVLVRKNHHLWLVLEVPEKKNHPGI